ncbi:hypothetical protein TNCV_1214271 [Trichonephila clavipes]|nr:hypothetical protein TNCV_1214271 [Trichonephila clavipes]
MFAYHSDGDIVAILRPQEIGALEDVSRRLQRETVDEVDHRLDVGQTFVTGAFERDQGHCSVRASGVLLRLRCWGQTIWGLLMRDDEGRVVAPPLEFKRIDSQIKREDERLMLPDLVEKKIVWASTLRTKINSLHAMAWSRWAERGMLAIL